MCQTRRAEAGLTPVEALRWSGGAALCDGVRRQWSWHGGRRWLWCAPATWRRRAMSRGVVGCERSKLRAMLTNEGGRRRSSGRIRHGLDASRSPSVDRGVERKEVGESARCTDMGERKTGKMRNGVGRHLFMAARRRGRGGKGQGGPARCHVGAGDGRRTPRGCGGGTSADMWGRVMSGPMASGGVQKGEERTWQRRPRALTDGTSSTVPPVRF
jgi:hypothetical protein